MLCLQILCNLPTSLSFFIVVYGGPEDALVLLCLHTRIDSN